MQSLWAFLAALAVLVAVHEYGHYKVAVLCGVRVLRFSLGFGPVLYRRPFGPAFALGPSREPASHRDGESEAQADKALGGSSSRRQGTLERSEFVLSLIPLGGYVSFWDEAHVQERALTEPLSDHDRAALFESQSLFKRSLIVLAGPLANLLLCVLLTWVMYLWGVEQMAPVLASPVPASVAQKLGFEAGERVLSVGIGGRAPHQVESLEDFEEQLESLRREHLDAVVWTQKAQAPGVQQRHDLPWSLEDVPDNLEALGFQGPYRAAVIQSVSAASPAERAGLKPQDRVISVDGVAVSDAADLRRRIAQSLQGTQAQDMAWQIVREAGPEGVQGGGGEPAVRSEPSEIGEIGEHRSRVRPESLEQTLNFTLRATPHEDRAGVFSARVGIYLGGKEERVTVQSGPWRAFTRALHTSLDWMGQTLKAMGQLFATSESWSNLGGPLTLAKYAGQSAGLGLSAYLAYLGLVSVNLGIFNLLPIPVLDGGHLLAYAWQALTGRVIGAALWGKIQRLGLMVVLILTLLALRNDIVRWWIG
jgi:regulator of sigma E protease